MISDKRDDCLIGHLAPLFHARNLIPEALLDPIDNRDRVRAWLSKKRAVHTSLAIDADDVGLDCCVILSPTDIAQKNRLAFPYSDWNRIDLLYARQGVDRMHLIVSFAKPHRATAENEIAFTHRPDHIRDCQVVGLQPCRIDIHHHLAKTPAKRMWNLHAFQPTQFVTDSVVADFVEFGFIESVA